MSWLLLFLVHNMAISIFRAIGAIARNIVVANACGSMMLMIILMLGGFVLPRGQIHGWWIWGYWIGTHLVMSVRMCVCFGLCVLLPVMLVVSLCWAASALTAVACKLGHLISAYAFLM
jgi:hypothetical protein